MSSLLARDEPHAPRVLRRKQPFCRHLNSATNSGMEKLQAAAPESPSSSAETVGSWKRLLNAQKEADVALDRLATPGASSVTTQNSRREAVVVDGFCRMSGALIPSEDSKDAKVSLPSAPSPKFTTRLRSVTRHVRTTLLRSSRARTVKISAPFDFVHLASCELQNVLIPTEASRSSLSSSSEPESSSAGRSLELWPGYGTRSFNRYQALSSHPVAPSPKPPINRFEAATPELPITNPDGEPPEISITNLEGKTTPASEAPAPGRLRISSGEQLLNPNRGIGFQELYLREKKHRIGWERECRSFAAKALYLERALLSLQNDLDAPVGGLVQMHRAEITSLKKTLHHVLKDRSVRMASAANHRLRSKQLEADNIELKARLAIEFGKREAAIRHKRLEPLLASVVNKNLQLQHQVEYFKKESLGQRVEAGNQRKQRDVAEHKVVLLEQQLKKEQRDKPVKRADIAGNKTVTLERQLKEQQPETQVMRCSLESQLAELRRTIRNRVTVPRNERWKVDAAHQTVWQRSRTIPADVYEIPIAVSMLIDDKDLLPLPLKLPDRAQVTGPQSSVRAPRRLQPLSQRSSELSASPLPPLQLPEIPQSLKIVDSSKRATEGKHLRFQAPHQEPTAAAELENQDISLSPPTPIASTLRAGPELEPDNDDSNRSEEGFAEGRLFRFGSRRVHRTKATHRLAFSSFKIEGQSDGETGYRLDTWFWSSVPDLELWDPRED